MRRKSGFTLIEVLVVVSIIALLLAIMLPSLARARVQARLTVCGTHLHQVGLAMMAYMQDSRDHMPSVSSMPSVSRVPVTPLTDPVTNLPLPPIYFADVIRKHMPTGKNSRIPSAPLPPGVYPAIGSGGALECSEDRPGNNERPEPPGRRVTYYMSERTSYEFRTSLNGLMPSEFAQHAGGSGWRRRHDVSNNLAPATIWFARDYWNFHNKEQQASGPDAEATPTRGSIFVPGAFPARRYVYIDGHVSDYEN